MIFSPHCVPIRVLLADSQDIFREGLKALIGQQTSGQVHLVKEVVSSLELFESVASLSPDVIIADSCLPHTGALGLCRQLSENHPQLRVILLSSLQDDNALVNAFSSGIKGLLTKDCDTREFLEAVHTVHNGGRYLCQKTSRKLTTLLGKVSKKSTKQVYFTQKELLIIKKICQQLTSKEIAAELQLTSRTVEDYRKKIQEKMGAKNMVGIALYAIKHNLIKVSEV